MAWLVLFFAGLFEIGAAVTLKRSAGFSELVPSLLFLVCAALSVLFLNAALKTLPLGTAYAVWTGIGAAGTAAWGILVLGEAVTIGRLGAMAMIIGGVVALQVAGGRA
jgi:quaternary ammonium compound-resistance protein SugE